MTSDEIILRAMLALIKAQLRQRDFLTAEEVTELELSRALIDEALAAIKLSTRKYWENPG
jgi:hypothetical protein